jgi:hypothetical protein
MTKKAERDGLGVIENDSGRFFRGFADRAFEETFTV